jgi:hypothetical protein
MFPGPNIEPASAGRYRVMTQRQGHQATGTHQRRDTGYRALALAGIEMHPDRSQHDDVVALAQLVHGRDRAANRRSR